MTNRKIDIRHFSFWCSDVAVRRMNRPQAGCYSNRGSRRCLIRRAHATRVPVWRLAQTNFESRRQESRKMNRERRKRGVDFRSTLNHQLSTFFSGGIAQLVERQLCKLEVRGSNPLASKNFA